MLSGEQIGAYSLSELQAGSGRRRTELQGVTRDGDAYVLNGSKAWITHGGRADFYTLLLPHGRRLQRHLVLPAPGDPDGLSCVNLSQRGEDGLHAVLTTRRSTYQHCPDADRLIGAKARIVNCVLGVDSGRLGIVAVAVGTAQAALTKPSGTLMSETTFGRKII